MHRGSFGAKSGQVYEDVLAAEQSIDHVGRTGPDAVDAVFDADDAGVGRCSVTLRETKIAVTARLVLAAHQVHVGTVTHLVMVGMIFSDGQPGGAERTFVVAFRRERVQVDAEIGRASCRERV